MELQNILIRQARLVPFTTTTGKQSSFFELSLVHGQRVSTQFDSASGQRVTVYGPNGQPMMKDDVLTIDYYGSDAATMQQLAQQLNLTAGCAINLTLHSFNQQNRSTGRWATQWMLPENIQVVAYPQQVAAPQYAQPAAPQPQYPPQAAAPQAPQGGFNPQQGNAPW